jgi:beta-xylosidase
MSNVLGIDVLTDDQSLLIVELADQPEVFSVRDAGVYKEDVNYSQVHIDTSWTEEELEEWLYSHSKADYVGVFHAR